jgi:hypothetical protein
MNMQVQIDFSRTVTNAGIKRAEDHANKVHGDWSQQAFEFLKIYLRHNKNDFMTEDVRNACKGVVPEAPTARAWGAIILKAAHADLIRKVGIRPVKNLRAHRANAAVWRRV